MLNFGHFACMIQIEIKPRGVLCWKRPYPNLYILNEWKCTDIWAELNEILQKVLRDCSAGEFCGLFPFPLLQHQEQQLDSNPWPWDEEEVFYDCGAISFPVRLLCFSAKYIVDSYSLVYLLWEKQNFALHLL